MLGFFGFDEPKTKSKGNEIHPDLKKAWKDEFFKKQGGRCKYCGTKFPYVGLEVEHKIPRERGGDNRKSNLHLTCGRCNKRKGTLTDSEFRKKFRDAGVPQTQKLPERAIPQSKFDAVAKVASAKTSSSRAQVVHAPHILTGKPACGGRGRTIGNFIDMGLVTCRKCLNG